MVDMSHPPENSRNCVRAHVTVALAGEGDWALERTCQGGRALLLKVGKLSLLTPGHSLPGSGNDCD